MKRFFYLFIILLSSRNVSAQNELNVMTFNIRLNTASDSLNAWQYRMDKVASITCIECKM